MEIKFFSAKEFESNLKCSIHKTGRLGFSGNAVERLKLEQNRFIRIGSDENEITRVLYMKIHNEDDGESFRANKAGDYFYVNTKPLFDKLGIDYVNNVVIFDIVGIDYEGETIYKLTRREKRRGKNK